jgi:signal transduction histidine kinase
LLINDVLDLSKIEAGRVEMSMEHELVSAIVNDVTSTIEPLARKNGNTFTVTAADPGAVVYVDAVKFRQCLLNLLSNACKFTRQGSIALTVTRRMEGTDEWCLWAVSDTGIGIDEADIKKLFQPFSQVDSSATRRHGGTGLGLAISRRLVEMMGGRISVKTKLGHGATFTIYIPCRPQPPVGARAAAESASK